ncbi:outer membrane protein assembly factor BamC [Ferrimonas marina]|uniref:Outer membrane protein assembly factor BamC n=1 Tax=Ferrimonas marina TaxID=299255 RepID=A0A1M5REL8_9GAMM|nr:outer membrane protein assembly factor BamC [Ferrimonas marina]SHH24711.1 Beta-barrel assembly machine subunit BamC [Ferrimonas marina]
MKRSIVAVAVLAMVGCSTPLERRQASGGFDYLEEKPGVPLVIPETLEQPRFSNEFALPDLGERADADVVGPRLDVRPPLQVLPLAPGTRLQDGVDSVTVLIESNDDDLNLASEIDEALVGFLNEKGVNLAQHQGGTITTDWIENQEVIGKKWWREQVYEIRQRYQFDTQVKDHGRTGSITIELVDHEEGLDGIDDSIVLTDADRRRYAIDMLNSAISYMNFERGQRQMLRDLEDGRGFNTELGFDRDENAAFLAEADFDTVWGRMSKVLPALGFEVRDLDKGLATYFVEYDSDLGFWSKLWGDNDQLPLDEGSYQILLDSIGERTSITLMDNNGDPLDNETVTGLYNRFAELLQKELRDL